MDILIELAHQKTEVHGGINYYYFFCFFWPDALLPDTFDSRILKKIVGAVLDGLTIGQVPQSIKGGRAFRSYDTGSFVAPTDLYLFGVREVSGVSGDDMPVSFPVIDASVVDTLQFVSAIAVYTPLQPDDSGLIYVPSWETPNIVSHFEYMGDAGTFWVPRECLEALSDFDIARSYGSLNYNWYCQDFIFLFDGAPYTSGHFLNHLDVHVWDTPHPDLGAVFRNEPGTPRWGLKILDWTPPDYLVYGEYDGGNIRQWQYSLYFTASPVFFFPDAPIPAPGAGILPSPIIPHVVGLLLTVPGIVQVIGGVLGGGGLPYVWGDENGDFVIDENGDFVEV